MSVGAARLVAYSTDLRARLSTGHYLRVFRHLDADDEGPGLGLWRPDTRPVHGSRRRG